MNDELGLLVVEHKHRRRRRRQTFDFTINKRVFLLYFSQKKGKNVFCSFQGELKKEGEHFLLFNERINNGEFSIEQYIINHN